jgi:hypothetical protein
VTSGGQMDISFDPPVAYVHDKWKLMFERSRYDALSDSDREKAIEQLRDIIHVAFIKTTE